VIQRDNERNGADAPVPWKSVFTRREYFETVLKSRHLCVREFLKIVVPGRWQSADILENICQHYGHRRLLLPEFSVEELFPGLNETSITVSGMPRGSWSTPITDQVMLAKLARLLRPKNILEVGSFRGYTARLLAENTASDCIIHALDINPDHGEAYIKSPLKSRIRRHIGSLKDRAPESLKGISFDYVFVDADHQFEAVESDTRTILPLLAEEGALIWHDYSDWGWMSSWNRVPEFLHNLSKEIPILTIPGTTLALHRRGWTYQDVEKAIEEWRRLSGQSHWESETIRGE
jgi:predicted O-methyltransferase YrrM